MGGKGRKEKKNPPASRTGEPPPSPRTAAAKPPALQMASPAPSDRARPSQSPAAPGGPGPAPLRAPPPEAGGGGRSPPAQPPPCPRRPAARSALCSGEGPPARAAPPRPRRAPRPPGGTAAAGLGGAAAGGQRGDRPAPLRPALRQRPRRPGGPGAVTAGRGAGADPWVRGQVLHTYVCVCASVGAHRSGKRHRGSSEHVCAHGQSLQLPQGHNSSVGMCKDTCMDDGIYKCMCVYSYTYLPKHV